MLAVAAASLAVLGGCYTSETAVLDADNSIKVAGVTEGVYCHAENMVTPQVAVSFEVSENLGGNKCRDLHFDPATGRYVDRLSPMIELRIGEMDMPVYLLQVQNSPTALARFAPIAIVEGMMIQFDPAGTWPKGLVEASGLALDDQGVLKSTEPSYVLHVLFKAFDVALARFREDIAFVEDEAGPRLEFYDAAVATLYLVYVRDGWNGDAVKMRQSMIALADKLGLQKRDRPFSQ